MLFVVAEQWQKPVSGLLTVGQYIEAGLGLRNVCAIQSEYMCIRCPVVRVLPFAHKRFPSIIEVTGRWQVIYLIIHNLRYSRSAWPAVPTSSGKVSHSTVQTVYSIPPRTLHQVSACPACQLLYVSLSVLCIRKWLLP